MKTNRMPKGLVATLHRTQRRSKEFERVHKPIFGYSKSSRTLGKRFIAAAALLYDYAPSVCGRIARRSRSYCVASADVGVRPESSRLEEIGISILQGGKYFFVYMNISSDRGKFPWCEPCILGKARSRYESDVLTFSENAIRRELRRVIRMMGEIE
ncbi:MAG: hypothetical protein DWQ01_08725 [Planctomycetota bacterium]|nr:MAG: hypothetical protein DWQ01_08725 [Planctomycetota bacterium]